MITRHRFTFMLATLTLLATIPGCSKNKSTNPPASGSTVTLNSGTLAAGTGEYVATFATAGGYPYHCNIHSVMQSTITVVATGGLDSLVVQIVNASSNGFQAQAVGGVTNLKAGGYVHWYNVSAMAHTVNN